jgi:HD-GYP domain-containing protein (c-di-GMP phosphodiesterase class II)
MTTGNLVSAPPQAMAREFGRAREIAARSNRTVSRAFLKVRLGKGFKTSMVEPVIDDILGSVERNPHAFTGLMQCREDNQSLYRHALATSALMISLGRQLRLPAEQLRHAGLAGLMLDVGINRLPVDLALIDHDLARVPRDVFEAHVELGHELCLEAECPEPVAAAVIEHHERSDGRGFPRGLRRAETSPLGRMAAICDAYEELANSVGGAGMTPAEAMEALAADPGAFDEALLAAFTEALGIYPIGTVLLLGSRRLAMVVDQNDGDPPRPRVVTFFSTVSGHKTAPELIDLGEGGDAIDSLARPESYGIADFPALRERLFAYACGA